MTRELAAWPPAETELADGQPHRFPRGIGARATVRDDMRDPAVLAYLPGLALDLAARMFRRGKLRRDRGCRRTRLDDIAPGMPLVWIWCPSRL